MRADLPTGTVTFLFTDIEGSTKLLRALGPEGYADALSEHRRLIRGACATGGGIEVDTQGDACFLVFPTAVGALTAAGALTEALSDGPIQVRVGLHTGTPLLTDEGYVGDDVHLAARIAASSHGGQVVFSAATAERFEGSFTDLGEHRLKDIDGPVSIYQLGDGSFPPLKTISSTNLPRPASSFVGREDELVEVLSRIERGARLVTLTGPGGTGKTRLALEAATSLVPEYRAGVFWVGLASLRDATLVTETVAQTLGARDGLAAHIGDRELLLLLDNLEQVIEAAPELSSLLEECPNLTLLVTSRERLRVQGEVEYPVPPLAPSEAVSLFCERAQVEPTEEIVELCARLDSLPLAVELAAARTKVLSPAQILERLSQRLDLLEGGRDADPRQQTLRATIEWSYDLLSADEQALFAQLSVFGGGCTLEAAEEVADAVLGTLQSLVEKSLLRFSEERYWMLETIREFARERLEESGEVDAAVERLHRHLVGLAESEGAPMFLGRQAEAFDRLGREHDNVRVVVDWAVRRGRPEVVAELVTGFALVWNSLGHVTEAKAWVDHALEARGRVADEVWVRVLLGAEHVLRFAGGEVERAQLLMEESLELLAGLDEPWLEAMALTELSDLWMERGDFERARRYAEQSLEIRQERGLTTGRALFSLGEIALRQGDLGRAQGLLDEAARALAELGHEVLNAYAVAMLGEVAHRRGDYDRAAGLLVDAVSRGAAFGDEGFVGESLRELALVERDRGNVLRAAHLWTMGGTLWRRAGSPISQRQLEIGDLPELAQVEPADISIEDALAYVLEGAGGP